MVYAPRSRSVLRARPHVYANGLVGWWTFDDGQAYDSSGNGNNGTKTNTPTFIGGFEPSISQPGALTFNGSSSYVDFGAPTFLEIYTPLTISAWIYSTNAVAGSQFVISKDFSTGNRGFGLGVNNNTLYLETNGATRLTGTGKGLTNSGWHHIAATNSAGTWIGYADGVSTGTASPGTPNANTSAHWYVGGRQYVGAFSGFTGGIDDVRIYNIALSAAEINTLYCSAFLPWMEAEMPALLAPAAMRHSLSVNTAVSRTATW